MTVPFSASKDTLAYQLGARPLTRMIDFSQASCKDVMAEFKDKLSPHTVEPEQDALYFYALNHAVAKVRELKLPTEPLGEYLWVLDEYHRQLVDRAVRLFRYLTLICTRECRHAASSGSLSSEQWAEMADKYTPQVRDFLKQNLGKASTAAAEFIQTSPPDAPFGKYVEAMWMIFYHGKWGGSFGGKKWANVNDCLVKFVKGEYSAEMMLDTGWTLAHNGGPIFNKGMLYNNWDHKLYMILDVQRSGQIPQLIEEGCWVSEFVDQKLSALHEKFKAIPGYLADTDYVDWFKVEELGATKNWHHLQQQQAKKHGLPPDLAEKKKNAELAKLAEQQALAAKEAEEAAKYWELMPGEKIEKFQPDRDLEEVAA